MSLLYRHCRVSRAVYWMGGAIATSLSSLTLLVSASLAQLTPDSSLGSESSIVTPNATVRGSSADLIEGGAARGSNLFHSFEAFNLGTGQRVYFANPAAIENILTRVTGGSLSNIDGLLGVDGAANLFLLNPSGVIFGPNARLDIGGSFLTSTGSSFTFADGSVFSAVPTGNDLLSVSVPIGVQYGSNPGPIENQAALSVVRDLVLQGGTITSSGMLTTQAGNIVLEGETGNITIQRGTVQSGRDVVMRAANSITISDNSTLSAASDLNLRSNQSIDIANTNLAAGRDLVFQAPVRQLANGTTFTTGGYFITADLAGNPIDVLIPSEQVVFFEGNFEFTENYIGPSLYILALGNVTTAPNVTVIAVTSGDSGTVTRQIGNGLGDTQTITVNASNARALNIRASNIMLGTGDLGGDFAGVDINNPGGLVQLSSEENLAAETVMGQPAGNIVVGSINTSDVTGGNGGAIILRADGNVVITDTFLNPNGFPMALGSFSSSEDDEDENAADGGAITIFSGGNINILGDLSSYSSSGFLGESRAAGGAITLISGGNINILGAFSGSSGSSAAGPGGAITLLSGGSITASGRLDSGSFSFSGNTGSGGAITLLSRGEISVGGLESTSFSFSGNVGEGGAIRLSSRGNINVLGSLASYSFSRSFFSDVGNVGTGGAITLDAGQGRILGTNNARLFTFAVSEGGGATGAGGAVILKARDQISGLEVLTLASAANSGDVTIQGWDDLLITNVTLITSGQVEIPNPANPTETIAIDLDSLGASGSTTLASTGTLTLDQVQILSDANSNTPAGNITVTSPIGVRLINGSLINSNTNSTGPGGNIRFDTPQIFLDANSRITANAAATSSNTRGGSITFNAPGSLLLQGAGAISVNTASNSRAGDLTLNVPQIVVDGLTLSASTNGTGAGGSVNIRTSRLTFANGGTIAASTSGPGPGGSVTVTGNSPLTLQGNGRLTVAAEGVNSGRAGDLNVNASTLALRDGVELSVNSASRAGGGNVNIAVDRNMVMAGGSYINATSTNPRAGDGGNVNITLGDGFLIAAPGQDNDIIANAVGGNGGNINVRALRLYGFSQQDEPNVARLRGNGTNDISASSEVGLPGEIALNTLDLDPSQGLVELPVDLSDRANQVTPGCGLGNADEGSEFVATGRGGLPPGPSDPIAPTGVAVPWVVPDEGAPVAQVLEPEATAAPAPLVEAQGIAVDAAGNAYFVAEAADSHGGNRAQVAPQLCALSAQP